MKFAVSGLERTNRRKSLEVVIDSGMNDAFEDLGYEIEMKMAKSNGLENGHSYENG